MIRVVFDTNVFISALFNPTSPPARLLELALQGYFKLLISPPIIREIERVLTYPRVTKLLQKRKITPGEIQASLVMVLKIAVLTPGNLTLEAVPDDPGDDMILACALEGGADVIVSGDHHLKNLNVFRGVKILAPADCLQMVEA